MRKPWQRIACTWELRKTDAWESGRDFSAPSWLYHAPRNRRLKILVATLKKIKLKPPVTTALKLVFPSRPQHPQLGNFPVNFWAPGILAGQRQWEESSDLDLVHCVTKISTVGQVFYKQQKSIIYSSGGSGSQGQSKRSFEVPVSGEDSVLTADPSLPHLLEGRNKQPPGFLHMSAQPPPDHESSCTNHLKPLPLLWCL